MSRIHEALKRAQQQRELSSQQDGIIPDATGLDAGVAGGWTAEQSIRDESSDSAADAAILGMDVANLDTTGTDAGGEAYSPVLPPSFEVADSNNRRNGGGQLQNIGTTEPDLANMPSSSTPDLAPRPAPAGSEDYAHVRLPEEIPSLAPSSDNSEPGAMLDPASPVAFATLKGRCCKPTWRPDHDTMLFLDSKQQRLGSEEFRSFRTRLYQLRAKQALKRILISSPLPSEGKTFVAANLAQVLARQRGRRVLLVDGDLRLSGLHRPLGAPPTPGLSDYLRGTADLFSIVQMAPVEDLFLIAGGTVASNAAELIASPRLRQLFEQLSPCFDWIIVDSPPVVPIADAVTLANHCDGVVLVVNSGTTPFDMAVKSCQDLRHRPLLGVVLNRVAPKASSGRYYYDHYASGRKR